MDYVNCQTYTISSCFAVECQINIKLTRYLGVGVIIFLFSIIRHPRLPPIFTVSPKVAENRGKTVYIYIRGKKILKFSLVPRASYVKFLLVL